MRPGHGGRVLEALPGKKGLDESHLKIDFSQLFGCGDKGIGERVYS
jgi:hypothetical protein